MKTNVVDILEGCGREVAWRRRQWNRIIKHREDIGSIERCRYAYGYTREESKQGWSEAKQG